MANNIEWVDAESAHVEWTTTKGEWSDAFGSVNDGPALAFGDVVVEGTVAQLRAFAADVESAVNEMEDDGADE